MSILDLDLGDVNDLLVSEFDRLYTYDTESKIMVADPDFRSKLQRIHYALVRDKAEQTLHHHIGRHEKVQSILLPILIHYRDNSEYTAAILRVLSIMTEPVDSGVPLRLERLKHQRQIKRTLKAEHYTIIARSMSPYLQQLSQQKQKTSQSTVHMIESYLMLLRNIFAIDDDVTEAIPYYRQTHDLAMVECYDGKIFDILHFIAKLALLINIPSICLLCAELFSLALRLERPYWLYGGTPHNNYTYSPNSPSVCNPSTISYYASYIRKHPSYATTFGVTVPDLPDPSSHSNQFHSEDPTTAPTFSGGSGKQSKALPSASLPSSSSRPSKTQSSAALSLPPVGSAPPAGSRNVSYRVGQTDMYKMLNQSRIYHSGSIPIATAMTDDGDGIEHHEAPAATRSSFLQRVSETLKTTDNSHLSSLSSSRGPFQDSHFVIDVQGDAPRTYLNAKVSSTILAIYEKLLVPVEVDISFAQRERAEHRKRQEQKLKEVEERNKREEEAKQKLLLEKKRMQAEARRLARQKKLEAEKQQDKASGGDKEAAATATTTSADTSVDTENHASQDSAHSNDITNDPDTTSEPSPANDGEAALLDHDDVDNDDDDDDSQVIKPPSNVNADSYGDGDTDSEAESLPLHRRLLLDDEMDSDSHDASLHRRKDKVDMEIMKQKAQDFVDGISLTNASGDADNGADGGPGYLPLFQYTSPVASLFVISLGHFLGQTEYDEQFISDLCPHIALCRTTLTYHRVKYLQQQQTDLFKAMVESGSDETPESIMLPTGHPDHPLHSFTPPKTVPHPPTRQPFDASVISFIFSRSLITILTNTILFLLKSKRFMFELELCLGLFSEILQTIQAIRLFGTPTSKVNAAAFCAVVAQDSKIVLLPTKVLRFSDHMISLHAILSYELMLSEVLLRGKYIDYRQPIQYKRPRGAMATSAFAQHLALQSSDDHDDVKSQSFWSIVPVDLSTAHVSDFNSLHTLYSHGLDNLISMTWPCHSLNNILSVQYKQLLLSTYHKAITRETQDAAVSGSSTHAPAHGPSNMSQPPRTSSSLSSSSSSLLSTSQLSTTGARHPLPRTSSGMGGMRSALPMSKKTKEQMMYKRRLEIANRVAQQQQPSGGTEPSAQQGNSPEPTREQRTMSLISSIAEESLLSASYGNAQSSNSLPSSLMATSSISLSQPQTTHDASNSDESLSQATLSPPPPPSSSSSSENSAPESSLPPHLQDSLGETQMHFLMASFHSLTPSVDIERYHTAAFCPQTIQHLLFLLKQYRHLSPLLLYYVIALTYRYAYQYNHFPVFLSLPSLILFQSILRGNRQQLSQLSAASQLSTLTPALASLPTGSSSARHTPETVILTPVSTNTTTVGYGNTSVLSQHEGPAASVNLPMAPPVVISPTINVLFQCLANLSAKLTESLVHVSKHCQYAFLHIILNLTPKTSPYLEDPHSAALNYDSILLHTSQPVAREAHEVFGAGSRGDQSTAAALASSLMNELTGENQHKAQKSGDEMGDQMDDGEDTITLDITAPPPTTAKAPRGAKQPQKRKSRTTKTSTPSFIVDSDGDSVDFDPSEALGPSASSTRSTTQHKENQNDNTIRSASVGHDDDDDDGLTFGSLSSTAFDNLNTDGGGDDGDDDDDEDAIIFNRPTTKPKTKYDLDESDDNDASLPSKHSTSRQTAEGPSGTIPSTFNSNVESSIPAISSHESPSTQASKENSTTTPVKNTPSKWKKLAKRVRANPSNP